MNQLPRVWSLQEAKAKFSELLRRVQSDGPQTVTVHGKPFASVAAIDINAQTDDDKTGQVIVDAFKKCPVKDFEVERIRDYGLFRDVET